MTSSSQPAPVGFLPMFDPDGWSIANDARPEEAAAFLGANPDIAAVQLVLTDANGVGRGKNIAGEELAALFTHGRNVAGSILGLDMTGEDGEATGLVWAVGRAR